MEGFIQEFRSTHRDDPKTLSFTIAKDRIIIEIVDIVLSKSISISISKKDSRHFLRYFEEAVSLLNSNSEK